jgi:tetratricopeptide (TPR) repeat protein
MAANYIQHLLQESTQRYGAPLEVADRKQTSRVLAESDLAASGLATSSNPGATAKLLNVQGLVMSEINVKTDAKAGKQRTVSGMDIFGYGGRYWGGGGGSVDTTEVETVTRNITVQADFKLVDSATGKNWITHSPKPYNRTDRTEASPFFGSSQTEAELTPRDEIIAAAVEQGARQFVSKFVACGVKYEIEVESSGNAACCNAVKYLRGDMYEEAIGLFKAALAEDIEDDRAAFGAGVACEALGRYTEALDYYKRACVLNPEAAYLEQKNRLAADVNRIRPGERASETAKAEE